MRGEEGGTLFDGGGGCRSGRGSLVVVCGGDGIEGGDGRGGEGIERREEGREEGKFFFRITVAGEKLEKQGRHLPYASHTLPDITGMNLMDLN